VESSVLPRAQGLHHHRHCRWRSHAGAGLVRFFFERTGLDDAKSPCSSIRIYLLWLRRALETMQKGKEATLPGAIDLTVENVRETDTGYSVAVDGKTAKQNITNETCGLMDITPGLHEVSVAATLSNIPAHASQVVEVKAASATKVVFSLARAKSAGLSD
jgi:hypothetical protein